MDNVTVTRHFTIESAHFLPFVPNGHKCKTLHGHTYHIEIEVGGPLDPVMGWYLDFYEIDEKFESNIRGRIDHQTLNAIEGLDNPTTENLAIWIWTQIDVPGLREIRVSENPRSMVRFRG